MTEIGKRERFLLELPPVKPNEPVKKPYVSGMPVITELTEEQAMAYRGITEFTSNPSKEPQYRFRLLEGYAGTGKTYVVSKIVHGVLSTRRTAKVCMTAPTNKAVKVMVDSADYTHSNLEYMTLHSLLALREEIGYDGVQRFVRDKMREPAVKSFDLIVVDEVSMASDELFQMLYEELMQCGAKVLLVGDPCQIPPVNKVECIPFDVEKRVKYCIEVFSLTKIVRQAEGNPLIAASMRIRDKLDRGDIDLGGDNIVDGAGIVELSSSEERDQKALLAMLKAHYTSPNYIADPDFIKIIAYTNDSVDSANELVRGMIYGRKRKFLEPGERLVASKPIMRDRVIQFQTSDEMQVESYEVKTDKPTDAKWKVKYYETVVRHREKNGSTRSVIWIVHEDSADECERVMKEMVAFAKSRPPKSDEMRRAWVDFYAFQRRYAAVKYAYAITAHKSQGSTYDNAVVMVYDIATIRRIVDRNRILYTACTRPRNKLVAVGW